MIHIDTVQPRRYSYNTWLAPDSFLPSQYMDQHRPHWRSPEHRLALEVFASGLRSLEWLAKHPTCEGSRFHFWAELQWLYSDDQSYSFSAINLATHIGVSLPLVRAVVSAWLSQPAPRGPLMVGERCRPQTGRSLTMMTRPRTGKARA